MLSRPAQRTSPFRRLLLPLLVLAAIAVIIGWARVGAPPQVEITPEKPGLGVATPVQVTVQAPARGVSTVAVELVQGESTWPLAEIEAKPRPWWRFWGEYTPEKTLDLTVGRQQLPELREGEATIRVIAGRAPTWLRPPAPVVTEKTLPVRLRPPSLDLVSTPNYADQGGSGLVVYRVGEGAVRDGVRAGDRWFSGYPVPGDEALHFALFGVPYDLEEAAKVVLEVEDEVGNRADRPFLDAFKVHPLKHDTIRLDDAFLGRVVPAIQAETPDLVPSGDLLADYLKINGDLRAANAAELVKLGESSAHELLWHGAFEQMPNSQVMSTFADRRTYVYQDRDVDHQDHLGFDLASVRAAPVPASNAGVVVLARYFGIYGRTVVVDHGYGLMTLYAHLSSISVEEGQRVAKGDILGRTGATGLAGGDHLHFSTLIHGLPVNPLEWWDARWIERQILDKVNGS